MYLQIKVGYFGFCHAPKSTYIVCENDTPFPNLILPVHIKQAERKIDIYFIRKKLLQVQCSNNLFHFSLI